MDLHGEYRESVARLAGRIREYAPADIIDRFARVSRFDPSSFLTCPSGFEGTVCAVDGSNALLLDAGSFSAAVVRASASSYRGGVRHGRATTPMHLVAVHPDGCNDEFEALFSDCFASSPKALLYHDDPLQNAAVMRDTLEYWVALEMAGTLDAGDLILIDGTLRVSHASHDEILVRLMNLCNLRGILLAAVTKRTSLTWGGGYPIVPAAEGLAKKYGVPEPWFVRVSGLEAILDRQQSRPWKQRGDQYIARLHHRSQRAFKVELPRYDSCETVATVFSGLAAYADDGRITGYPYPLLDAHLTTKIGKDAVDQIRQDLMRGMAEQGMSHREYVRLFGDYHDEFDRY
ncbi:hypothetical protein ABH15_12585 [Methanoculleus taiwanensis]|uniref:NurA domain-containing protein n=1 Tax=Methanoculleus taiwanensis TaxID=1550565 RepID=A0A498GYY5_9EURY|nr:DNA double-strand break repair nuclease NurA [Methanoculleus taiwanensis]RXE55070.1 hypothetical protein ABH15_12585 [Methanoculleus taiwanensis]